MPFKIAKENERSVWHMRYSDDFINMLNQTADIYEIISQYVTLTPAGQDTYVGICPLPNHHEKDGSLTVFTHTNSWFCFGCSSGSNAIAFLMQVNQWSFLEAVDYLCEHLNIKKPSLHNFDKLFNENRTLELLYRRKLMRNTENSLNYLYDRGLTQATINRWGLGANGQNRIIFPLYDRDKNIIEFSKRYIVQPADKTDKYWHPSNYIDKKKQILKEYYNKSSYLYGIHLYDGRYGNCIYFCEGNLDAILADQYGLKNCLATFGTNFSDAHLSFLKATKKAPVFIYDNDNAGLKGMHKACKKCEAAGIKPYIVLLDEKMDLADLALREKESLVQYIEAHVTPYAYYMIKTTLETYKQAFYRFQENYYDTFEKALSLLDDRYYHKAKAYIYQQTQLDIETMKSRDVHHSVSEVYCMIEHTLLLYFKDLYMFQEPYYKIFTHHLHKLNKEDMQFARAFIHKVTGLELKGVD